MVFAAHIQLRGAEGVHCRDGVSRMCSCVLRVPQAAGGV